MTKPPETVQGRSNKPTSHAIFKPSETVQGLSKNQWLHRLEMEKDLRASSTWRFFVSCFFVVPLYLLLSLFFLPGLDRVRESMLKRSLKNSSTSCARLPSKKVAARMLSSFVLSSGKWWSFFVSSSFFPIKNVAVDARVDLMSKTACNALRYPVGAKVLTTCMFLGASFFGCSVWFRSVVLYNFSIRTQCQSRRDLCTYYYCIWT